MKLGLRVIATFVPALAAACGSVIPLDAGAAVGVPDGSRDSGVDTGADAGGAVDTRDGSAAAGDVPRPDAATEARAPLMCTGNLADCNGEPADGCEASLDSELHCGRCNNACGGAHATAACVAGQCGPQTCMAGFGDCNANRVDGCEQALNTDTRCGSCDQRCQSPTPFCAATGAAATCTNPALALHDQRILVPCGTPGPTSPPELCGTIPPGMTVCPADAVVFRRAVTLGGRAGTAYDVSLRFRGVLEPKVYGGGRGPGDHFYVGGTPSDSRYNIYRLVVSAPAQTYYLNYDEAGGESYRVFVIDHTKVVRINAGATVSLEVVDADCSMVRNCRAFGGAACEPYVVAGVPPAPAAYNGQFVHIEVVGVANAP